MAEVKAPFRNAYLINQPDLVKTVLVDRVEDFPKDAAVGRTLPVLCQYWWHVPHICPLGVGCVT